MSVCLPSAQPGQGTPHTSPAKDCDPATCLLHPAPHWQWRYRAPMQLVVGLKRELIAVTAQVRIIMRIFVVVFNV